MVIKAIAKIKSGKNSGLSGMLKMLKSAAITGACLVTNLAKAIIKHEKSTF